MVALAGLAVTAYPVGAQGLGEVARKEEVRRKDIKAPAKVYTNKDLGAVPGGPRAWHRLVSPAPAVAPAAAAHRRQGGRRQGQGQAAGPQKDQAYWSGRRKELQARLDTDQTLADALQTRINALTADFSSRADPVQRAGIERDRLKALSELDRMRKSVEDGKKALASLDEEARKAGVPAGWLR